MGKGSDSVEGMGHFWCFICLMQTSGSVERITIYQRFGYSFQRSKYAFQIVPSFHLQEWSSSISSQYTDRLMCSFSSCFSTASSIHIFRWTQPAGPQLRLYWLPAVRLAPWERGMGCFQGREIFVSRREKMMGFIHLYKYIYIYIYKYTYTYTYIYIYDRI